MESKKGSLEWDSVGKWILAIAVLLVAIGVIIMLSGKVDLGIISDLRFG
jgi:hypothetical protein